MKVRIGGIYRREAESSAAWVGIYTSGDAIVDLRDGYEAVDGRKRIGNGEFKLIANNMAEYLETLISKVFYEF